jgi:hypothetical protein
MIRHDKHRFAGEPEALQFHRRGCHGPRLPGSHFMPHQSCAAFEDLPNGILLMPGEIPTTEMYPYHARETEVRSVVAAEPQVVVTPVVYMRKPISTRGIGPHPIPESFFEVLLFFPRRQGLCLIDNACSIGLFVVNRRRSAIQRVFDQFGGAEPRCSIRCRIADQPLGAMVSSNSPGGDRFCMRNLYCV